MHSVNPAEFPDGVLHIEDVGGDTESFPDGPTGRTIAEWREYLAEHGSFIIGPTGKRFDISLAPWADRSENTHLAIYVKYVNPARVGTKDPQGRPHRR